MDDVIKNDELVDKIDETYLLQEVNLDIILNDLNISDTDKALTKSIIIGIESNAAEAIKEYLTVALPNVGTIQKDATRTLMKDRWQELQEARKSMPKDDYLEYAKKVRKEIKDELAENYRKRKVIEKFKRKNKKTYDKLAKRYGLAYANFYVQSIIWLHEIPYDDDIQKQYDIINGRWEE